MALLNRSSRTRNGTPQDGAADGFVRDRLTMLAYGGLACFAYCLYGLGAILPFLRASMHLSYTVTTLHSVLWAGGAIIAGLAFRRLAGRLGMRRLMWGSMAASCAGIALLAAARVLALTLTAALLMGTAGTVLQIATSAILADRHGRHRDRALVEANAGAVAMAVLAPLVFGGLGGTVAGWRAALLLPLAGYACLYLVFRRLPVPGGLAASASNDVEATDRQSRQEHAGLPSAYWVRAVLVAITVAIEFCVVFYGAELLHAAGLAVARAATALTLFYLGELAGRLTGTRLARRRAGNEGSRGLTAGSLAVALAGFLAFWLAGRSPLALAGLFVTGLGVANLYPLTLGLAMSAVPGDSGRAAARTQVLGGIAMMAAPFALSLLADGWGVGRAFIVEPVLIAAAAVLLALTARGRTADSGRTADRDNADMVVPGSP